MNRNTVVSNGTVFGLWPLGRSMVIVGVFLVAIFVLMEPEASQGLGLIDRVLKRIRPKLGKLIPDRPGPYRFP